MIELKDFVIEEGVLIKYVGQGGDVVIPDSVTSIRYWAFEGCTSLTSVTIPKSVTSIGDSAFRGCDSLTSITVDNNNQNYKSIDGNLYSKDGKTLIQYAIGKTAKEFTIPETITSIGSSAFSCCDSLTSIEIPDSVTSIGDSAFFNCTSLTSVTIPNSVTSISSSTFSCCDSLASIEIPDSVTTIGSSAFSCCYSLTSIEIPDSVTSICGGAFEDCRELTSLKISSNLKEIEDTVFFGCNMLTNIILPNGVTSIGNSSFEGCWSLTNIDIPDSIISIGEEAFYRCKSLTSIIIPNSVKSVGKKAFVDCKKVVVKNWLDGFAEKDNKTTIVDLRNSSVNVLYNFDQKALSLCCFLENLEKGIEYSDNVKAENFDYIKKQRKKLYSYAINNIFLMRYMTNKKIIPLEDAMQISSKMDSSQNIEIKAMLMAYIDSFGNNAQEKVVEKQEKKIEKELFTDPNSDAVLKATWNYKKNPDGTITLNSLKQEAEVVIIPEKIGKLKVTALNDRCFKDKKKIRELIIPCTITSFGKNVFLKCKKIEKVNYLGTIDQWAQINFVDEDSNPIANAKKFYLNDKLLTKAILTTTNISNYAFYGCLSLTSVILENSVNIIGDSVFSECRSLANITIGTGIKSMGNLAFFDCDSLQSVNYLGTIDQWAQISFVDEDSNPLCYAKNLYINDALVTKANITTATKISASAFSCCRSLTSVVIPDGVTSIGIDAFSNCHLSLYTTEKNLKYLKANENPYFLLLGATNVELSSCHINSQTKHIGEYAFFMCKSLRSIEIPDSVTNIGESAFSFCKKLISVTIPDSVTRIGEDAFCNCESLTSVVIGRGVKYIAENAFKGCKNLIIKAKANSVAKNYAEKKDIKFIEI